MKIRFLLSTALVLFFGTVYSQEYLEMIEAETYTVAEIVENAEAYFEDKDKGRGSGYKQFKRWEYMANRLMDENGYLVPVTERLSELERYNAYLNETADQRVSLNDNWVELGPTSYNATTHWSPGVGRVTGIAVDLTNEDHMIIGANTGGVWRTTDGGANWTPMSDYFSNLYVYSVAIDPTDSDTYFFGSSSGLIYKSEDAGATWTEIADLSSSLVNKILINPDNTDIIFASSQNAGLFRSTDGGVTWTEPIPTDNRSYDMEFKPGDTNTVYASGNGFHVSTDGGATFTTITGFANDAKMIGVSANDNSVVYVVEANGGSFGGFYASSDSGNTFTELDHTGRNYFGYDTAGFDSGGQAPRDMDITVNPNDVNEVHIAGILTWRSTDGGANFSITSDWIPDNAASANIGYCHADVDILEFIGTNLYAGTDGGIFKAANTASVNSNYYEDLTDGIGIRQWYKIGVSQTPEVVVTGGSQDNGSSFYKASTGEWIDFVGADGMEGFVDKDDTDVVYAMIQFGAMYRTDNGGATLINLPEPPPGGGNWVTPFEQDPTVTNTIYLGYRRVYKSENKGGNWAPISQDIGANFDEMKIAKSNNQVIYASRSSLIYRTEDGGATDWTQLPQPGGIINNFAVHPSDPNTIAAVTTSSNKVLISEDGGQTWNNRLLNLPNFAALSVVWDGSDVNGLYVGMDYGIYYIDDTLSEWQVYNNNLPNVIVNELEINNADGMIYAGTYGRGLWASPVVNIVLGTEDFLNGAEVGIYPNPANDEVKIVLEESMEADIRVFDVAGKLVIYQPDVYLENHHAIDVSNLNNGLYFIRINTENGSVTKKLMKR